MSKKSSIYKITLAAMFLTISLILPFLTGQIKGIGNALCPMHFPILLCGYFCGPWYSLIIGFLAPIIRFAIFGMPPIYPVGISMCFELASYGLVVALLYNWLPKKFPFLYISLISALIAGKLVWGSTKVIIYGLEGSSFGWAAFVSGAFVTSIPGIIIQLTLIPLLVYWIKKQKIVKETSNNQ